MHPIILSLLDVDEFSELHSGGFWNFDELTNFKQFKSSNHPHKNSRRQPEGGPQKRTISNKRVKTKKRYSSEYSTDLETSDVPSMR